MLFYYSWFIYNLLRAYYVKIELIFISERF